MAGKLLRPCEVPGLMALGVPDHPPEGLEFRESLDDESCPVCEWDTNEASLDPQASHNNGILIAIEREQSPYSAMQAAVLLAKYWRCPNKIEDDRCLTLFTTEEEVTNMGGMS